MNEDTTYGILLAVSVILFISFAFGLWTENGDGTEAPTSPLLLFNY